MRPILVVGATGATGKHVVQQLLDLGHTVRVIVRSKERMEEALSGAKPYSERLQVKEASLLELSDEDLAEQVQDTEAVVCCLGHNLNFHGVFGHPRRLVADSARRLTAAMKSGSQSSPKFVLMGTEGVANPSGGDEVRSFSERALLTTFSYLLPPHADNMEAAEYVYSLGSDSGIEWVVVRPCGLIDGDVSEYVLADKTTKPLFGGAITKRSNVAKCMVDLLTDDAMWAKYKFTMPYLEDKEQPDKAAGK